MQPELATGHRTWTQATPFGVQAQVKSKAKRRPWMNARWLAVATRYGVAGREYRSMIASTASSQTWQKASLRVNIRHCICGR
jgi:hypothetical protein